mmetsp:Transcript_28056/g.90723  ORF Transcript_28056/g.90723 Transcript_28056/m.90723 type:complete len:275 (+) Transcript_28056:287-1111(+)
MGGGEAMIRLSSTQLAVSPPPHQSVPSPASCSSAASSDATTVGAPSCPASSRFSIAAPTSCIASSPGPASPPCFSSSACTTSPGPWCPPGVPIAAASGASGGDGRGGGLPAVAAAPSSHSSAVCGAPSCWRSSAAAASSAAATSALRVCGSKKGVRSGRAWGGWTRSASARAISRWSSHARASVAAAREGSRQCDGIGWTSAASWSQPAARARWSRVRFSISALISACSPGTPSPAASPPPAIPCPPTPPPAPAGPAAPGACTMRHTCGIRLHK